MDMAENGQVHVIANSGLSPAFTPGRAFEQGEANVFFGPLLCCLKSKKNSYLLASVGPPNPIRLQPVPAQTNHPPVLKIARELPPPDLCIPNAAIIDDLSLLSEITADLQVLPTTLTASWT